MTKKAISITEATSRIFSILEPLDPVDRKRVVDASMMLLGQEQASPKVSISADTSIQNASVDGLTPRSYFDSKKPNGKMEAIAVAARFRELSDENIESSTIGEIQEVFKQARRDFDSKHFARDLENAKAKKWFVRNAGRGVAQLLSVGQNFVDALPERPTERNGKRTSKSRAKKQK